MYIYMFIIIRVTSGLVVLAKSSEAAASISKEIREHSTEKVYLARVRGRFPARLGHMQELTDPELTALPTDGIDDELGDDDAVSKAPSSSSSSKNIQSDRELPSYEETGRSTGVGYGRSSRLLLDEGGFIFVRCPIAVVSFREGIHICDSKGKVSLSAFRSLGYDESSDTSLVECRPYTGRTHQLRLHLEFVGNPIANDPCYGGEIFYGDSDKRIKAVDTLQLLQQQGLKPMTKVPHFSLRPNELARIAESKAVSSEAQSNIGELVDDPQGADESDAAFLGRTCRYCKGHLCGDVERWLHCDGIWLHALRYCGNNWAFETTLPDWAMNNNFGAINALKLNK